MRIRLLKTYSGEQGTGREGDVQDVAESFAYSLIAVGAAISLEIEAAAFTLEKPKRNGRTKKVETRIA